MITANRPRGGNARILHSQAALELALTIVAVVAGAALLRAAVLAAGIGSGTWSVSLLVDGTQPLVVPLQLLPGGSRNMVGAASLADLTTAVLLVVLPVFILSRPTRQ